MFDLSLKLKPWLNQTLAQPCRIVALMSRTSKLEGSSFGSDQRRQAALPRVCQWATGCQQRMGSAAI
jgi:hypothetical protein